MQGKLVLITGATAGIGKETAFGLAKLGAHVVMVGRNQQRSEAAQAEVKQRSGNEHVDLLLADLSSQDHIRKLAAEFKSRYDRLDVLVNNAGALNFNRLITVDGYEVTFAVNHLAYFLLTNLLLDVLKGSAPARIINISSNAHEGGHLSFDDLMGERGYTGMRAYSQSKLANIVFSYDLAERLNGTGVTVNAVHPGFVGSEFAKNNGLLYRIGMNILRPFIRTVQQGADTIIYLASAPEVEGITGKYWYERQPIQSIRESHDANVQRRLWEVSEELTRQP